MILEGTREEMTNTRLGGIVKQGQFSSWVSQQSLFSVGNGQREAGEIIGKKAGFTGVVLQPDPASGEMFSVGHAAGLV